MQRMALLLTLSTLILGSACSHPSRNGMGGVSSGPATASHDGGPSVSPDPPAQGTGPSVTSDAASPEGQSVQPDAASPGLVDQAAEYLTCKPEELNPIVDCLTVTCPMQADPVTLVMCLTNDCGKLVEQVSPKCRDCVIAGVAQDTTGLVQNCLDTTPILGDASVANPLPF